MLFRLWLSLERCAVFNLIRLFRIRGQSERVARGFALGFMVNFFPTFGFGVVISAALARLIGGNIVAGFVGGASMTFFWPLLFYLNMRTGSLFVRPPLVIDELDDVTEKSMNALVWGQTFTFGAVINSLTPPDPEELTWAVPATIRATIPTENTRFPQGNGPVVVSGRFHAVSKSVRRVRICESACRPVRVFRVAAGLPADSSGRAGVFSPTRPRASAPLSPSASAGSLSYFVSLAR